MCRGKNGLIQDLVEFFISFSVAGLMPFSFEGGLRKKSGVTENTHHEWVRKTCRLPSRRARRPFGKGLCLQKEEEMIDDSLRPANRCETGCLLRETVETGKEHFDQMINIVNRAGRTIPLSIRTWQLKDEEGEVFGGNSLMDRSAMPVGKEFFLSAFLENPFRLRPLA